MKSNALTLRQMLNQLQASVNENLTEEQLLDLPIKIHIPSGSAQYTTTANAHDCSIHKKSEYSKVEQRVIVKEVWIDINTNPAV